MGIRLVTMFVSVSSDDTSVVCYQVDAIRAVIKKELELPIVEVLDSNATLDGGDVLFTGEFRSPPPSQDSNKCHSVISH